MKPDPMSLDIMDNLNADVSSAESYESSGLGSDVKQELDELKMEIDSYTKCKCEHSML